MDYTDKEIEIIKANAYNKGRIEGVIITIIAWTILLIVALR